MASAKIWFALGCILACGVALAPAQSPGERRVLNGLEIAIDQDSGALLRLAHPATGVILESSPDLAGLVSVSVPDRKLEPRGSQSRISGSEESIVIAWDALGGPLKDGKIGAEVTIRPAPDGRSVILACRLKNQSTGTISQVLFPDFKGLRPIDDPKAMELRMALGAVNPFAHPVRPEGRARFYPPFIWQRFPFEPVYQMHGLRWMDLGSLKGGLSVFQRKWIVEPVPSLVTRRPESDPSWMELAWQEVTSIGPGQSWESGEYWLTPHEGGWAKGIEPYRRYVKQMNPPRHVPRRIQEGVGFQSFWINTQSYKFIPRLAADAIKHGIDEVCLFVWCSYGHIPIRINPKLGTLEDFLAAVKQAKVLGVTITPFCNMKNLDDSLAARYGVTPGTGSNWNFDGGAPTSQNPLGSPSGQFDIDTRNPVWQQDVIAELNRWADLGVTSFAWDVFQEYGSMGLVNTIKQVREYIRAKDPEGAFCAEPYLANMERVTQVGDYTWNWLDYIEAGPYLNAIRYPRINCNVERDPRAAKMAFADGLYINAMPKQPDASNGSKLIGEEPELAAALKLAAARRKQFLPFFVEGNFLGESVLSRPVCAFVRNKNDGEIGGALFASGRFEYPELFVRGHQLKDRLLVIVLNNGEKSRAVSVPSKLALWLPRTKEYQVRYYNNSGALVRTEKARLKRNGEWVGKTDPLKPLEMAYVEIQALKANADNIPVEPTAPPETPAGTSQPK